MSTEGQQSKDPTQDEERFWNDFDRQYFSPPHPSLILLLKSHIWHLRHISTKVGSYLESKKSVKKKIKKNNSLYLRSVKFPIRLLTLDKNNTNQNVTTPGVFKYFSTSGTLSNEQIQGLLENDNVYKPLVSAKHDTNQRLPTFYSSSLPDAIHLSLYVPPYPSKSTTNKTHSSKSNKNKDKNKDNKDKNNNVDESLASFVDSFRSVQLLDNNYVPQIICGPCPSWFSKGKGRFKKGTDLGPKYKRCDRILKNPQGLLSDPVWQHFNTNYITDTSFEQLTFPPGTKLVRTDSKLDDDGDVPEGTDLLNYHNMCDSGSCRVDYSPHLFTFVTSKKNPLCKRCLGFPGLCCNLCKNSQGSSSAIFSSQFLSDEKYHMTYNSMDMFRLRSTTNESIQNYYVNPYQRPNQGKDLGTFSLLTKEELSKQEKNKDELTRTDDEQLIYNYIQTLESLNMVFSSLLNRVLKEYKPDSSRWQEIETKMLNTYIEQYNNNTFDNRYTYSVQRQSVDVLQIRLKVKRSSELPPSWTDRALCSICGSDDDWDDDPILFCDCCFIPMHFCCLGYKPGTLSDVKQKLNMNKIQRLSFFTYLLNSPDKAAKKVKLQNMDDLVDLDEDEWYCPICSHLMDQLSFMDENLVMAIIRTVGGPKNIEQIKLIQQTNANTGNRDKEEDDGTDSQVSDNKNQEKETNSTDKENTKNKSKENGKLDTTESKESPRSPKQDKNKEKQNQKHDQVIKYKLPYILGFDYDNPLERVYVTIHSPKSLSNNLVNKPNSKETKFNDLKKEKEKLQMNNVNNTFNREGENSSSNRESYFRDFYFNNSRELYNQNYREIRDDEVDESSLEQTSVLNLYGPRKESISYNSNSVVDPKMFCKFLLSKKGLYFEHTFWKLLSRLNLYAIQEYLNHFTIEDLSLSRLVQQDKIIQNAKLLTKKRSGSIESKLSSSRSMSLSTGRDFVSVKKEPENENKTTNKDNKKDDLRYCSNNALNCKNPLKRLYVSINLRNLSKICPTSPSSHKDKSHSSYNSVPIIPSSSGTGTTIHIQKEPMSKEKTLIEFDDVDIVVKIPVCIFCGFDAFIPGGGPMKKTSNGGTWGHIKCALANDCTIEPDEINYGTFVPKIKALKCIFCSNWSTSVVQCSYGNCCKAFHVPCSSASPNCLFTWDTNGKPDVLCPVHSKGLAPTTLLRKLQMRLLNEKKDKEKDKFRDGKRDLDKNEPSKDKLLKKYKVHRTPGRHKLKDRFNDRRFLVNKIRERNKEKEDDDDIRSNRKDKDNSVDLDEDKEEDDDGYADSDKENTTNKSKERDSIMRSVIKGSRDMVDNLSISENLHLTHFLRPNYNNLTKLLELLLNEKVGTIFQSNLSSNSYYKENTNKKSSRNNRDTNDDTNGDSSSSSNLMTCYSNISSSRSKHSSIHEQSSTESVGYKESEKDEEYVPTILTPRSTSLTRFNSSTSRRSSSYNDLLDKEVDVFIDLDPEPDPEIEMLLKSESLDQDPKKLLLGKEQLLSKHKLSGQGRCPMNNINANNCFWCCLGFGLEGHNRHVFDDKTPTAKQVLTILYNNNMSNIPLIKSMINCKRYDNYFQQNPVVKKETKEKTKNKNGTKKEKENNKKDNKEKDKEKKENSDKEKEEEYDEYSEDVCMDIQENSYVEEGSNMKIPWSVLSSLIMNDAIDDKISSFISNDLVNNNKLVKKNDFVINKVASEALVRLFNTFEPESTRTVVKTLFSLIRHIEFINKLDELYGYNTFYFSTGSAINTQHLLEKKSGLTLSPINLSNQLSGRSDTKTTSLVSNSTNDVTFPSVNETVKIPPLNLDALHGRDKGKLFDSAKQNQEKETSSMDVDDEEEKKESDLSSSLVNMSKNLVLPDGFLKQKVSSYNNVFGESKNMKNKDDDTLSSSSEKDTSGRDKENTKNKNTKENKKKDKDSPTSNKDSDKENNSPKTNKEKSNKESPKSARDKNNDKNREPRRESPRLAKLSDKGTPKSDKSKDSPKSSSEKSSPKSTPNKDKNNKESPKSSRREKNSEKYREPRRESPRLAKLNQEKYKEKEQVIMEIKKEEYSNRENAKEVKEEKDTSGRDKDKNNKEKEDKNKENTNNKNKNKENGKLNTDRSNKSSQRSLLSLDFSNLKVENNSRSVSPVRDKSSKESPKSSRENSSSRSNKSRGNKKEKTKDNSILKATKERGTSLLKEVGSLLSNNLDIRDMFKSVKERSESEKNDDKEQKGNNKVKDKKENSDNEDKRKEKEKLQMNGVEKEKDRDKDNEKLKENKENTNNKNKNKEKVESDKEVKEEYDEETEKRNKEKAAVKEQVFKLLKEVNEVEIIKIEKSLFPTSIIRKYVDNKKITICKVCLEFKYIENEMDSNKRKRNIYNESYRKCSSCNVEVCNSCLSTSRQDFENMTGSSLLIASDYVGEEIDDYQFVCVRCKDLSEDLSFPLLCCVLCSRYDGLMVKLNPKQLSFIPSKTSVWNSYCYAHLICLEWLYWSKNVNNTNKKANKSMFDQNCNYCGMLTGATITCSNASCLSKFHPSCAAFLGCKIDVTKKNESVVGVKRALCMRHTLISIARSSSAERKFMVAPCYLYEVLLNCNYFATFFKGVYLSSNCINTKAKLSSRFKLKRRRSFDYRSSFSVMKMASYINYGLVVNKTPQIYDLNLTEALARERLIQGMNYVFYQKSTHGPHTFFNVFDAKDPALNEKEGHNDFKNIINLLRNGLLKPAQGSKRGRKPKSLDGSESDKRQKMPMEDILKYGHCGVLNNGEYYCPLCFSIYFENSPGLPGDDLHWIGCDKCERWFHFVCAGVWVDYRDKDSWFCFHCSGSKN